jgi:hypothetical protein
MAITSSFSNLATVTRASKKTDAGGWDFTSGGTVGTLTEYASGVAAIHPTAGLLVEESSTNEIRNPRFEGATVGVIGSGGVLPSYMAVTGGGVAVEVISIGSAYMDLRLSGTATGNQIITFEAISVVAANASETWTASLGVQILAGSLTNISAAALSMRQVGAANTFPQTGIKSLLDASMRRFFHTQTTEAGTTNVTMSLVNYASGAIDVTYRLFAPQLEEKAYPTSPILPTVGSPAASTRAADSVAVANGSWSNDDGAGTIFAEFAFTYDGQASNFPRVLGYGADSSNRVDVYRNQATESLFALLSDGGATQASITTGTAPAATTKKVAVAWAADDVAFSVSGGTQQTDSSATIGFGAAVLRLGAGAGNTNASAGVYIKDLRYFPRRLSNAELEALVGN